MLKQIEGNLLDGFDNGEINVMAAVNNLDHKMGKGIALQIAKRYPKAVVADNETAKGDVCKLGSFSTAEIERGKFIINLYAQIGIGNNGDPLNRNFCYDHFYNSLYRLKDRILKYKAKKPDWTPVIGLPYKVGCGLAGGNWYITKKIIQEVFESSGFSVLIYQLPS